MKPFDEVLKLCDLAGRFPGPERGTLEWLIGQIRALSRLSFMLAPLGLIMGLPQDQTPDAPVPVCPLCGDRSPNLIDGGVYDCNECGVLFRIPQHLKEKP